MQVVLENTMAIIVLRRRILQSAGQRLGLPMIIAKCETIQLTDIRVLLESLIACQLI